MIVKVQMSLATSDGGRAVLIYDRTRRYTYETRTPEEVEAVADVLEGAPKAYFDAELDAQQRIVLNGRVPAQDW